MASRWYGSSSMALRCLRDRRGVTAIEFGFVGLAFFALLLGAVDFGRYQFTRESLRDSAAEAARVALITMNQALAQNPTGTPACPSGDTLRTAVTSPSNLTPMLNPNLLDYTSTPPTCTTNASTGVRTVTVTVYYPFQFVAPFMPRQTPRLSTTAALSY